MALFGSDKTAIGVDIGSSSVKIVSLKKDSSEIDGLWMRLENILFHQRLLLMAVS